jgi:hypothetical protein
MTLTEKVYGVITANRGAGPDNTTNVLHQFPRTGGGDLSQFELDCVDWGFTFGLAYGIARAEDPFEPNASVCERALEAARAAYTRWGDAKIFTSEAFDEDRAERPDSGGAVS